MDTSAAIKWMTDKYKIGYCAYCRLGGIGELAAIRQKALKIGAVKALTPDARKMFGLCERFARA